MNVTLKAMRRLLQDVRADLRRPHPFAHERVGFFFAVAATSSSGILLTIAGYQPVDDEDYERSAAVGAQIGSNAMRKAVQAAYRPQRSIIHVHTHGGFGVPGFSGVDLRSAASFVPGFYGPIPKMPHGLVVLSDDAAAGLYWPTAASRPRPIAEFILVGGQYAKNWNTHELA